MFECGDFTIRHLGNEALKGKSISGEKQAGQAEVYEARNDLNIYLKLNYVHWMNGERDVRASEVRGPKVIRHLECGNRRIEIKPCGDDLFSAILKQARIRPDEDDFSALYKASPADMDLGAGLNVREVLMRAGAVEFGEKCQVLEDRGRSRSLLCMTFARRNTLAPIVAFLLTRVLPLLNRYQPDAVQ